MTQNRKDCGTGVEEEVHSTEALAAKELSRWRVPCTRGHFRDVVRLWPSPSVMSMTGYYLFLTIKWQDITAIESMYVFVLFAGWWVGSCGIM